MDYKFYGWEHADVPAITENYEGIHTPRDLYDALSGIWCEYTCAPRMRGNWSSENRTLGQCSITVFWRRIFLAAKCMGYCGKAGITIATMSWTGVYLT